MATETFRRIDYSDENKFTLSEEGKIELKEYSDDLIFYSNFDNTLNATYYKAEDEPTINGTPILENSGVFSQYVLLENSEIIYNKENFEELSEKGSLKFRLQPKFNNAYGYQEFSNSSLSSLPIFPSLSTISKFGGKALNLTGDTQKYIDYDSSNISIMPQIGTINFYLKFDYTGTPSHTITILDIGNSGNNVNKIRLTHNSDGNLYFSLFDRTATKLFDITTAWSANEAWHEIEISYDLNNGNHNLFIDGISYGTSSVTGTRTNVFDFIRLGGTYSDFYIDDLAFFNTVLHTSNYTPRNIAFSSGVDNLIAKASFDTSLNLDVGTVPEYINYYPFSNTYGIRIKIDDNYINGGSNITIDLELNDDLNDIQNKLWIELDGTDVTAILTAENKIRIQGNITGQLIEIDEPVGANSLITALDGVDEAVIPNGPNEDVRIIEFYNGVNNNNRFSFIHTSNSHIYIQMYNSSGSLIVNEDLGLWSNENINWYAFEINWNKTLAEVFLDGTLISAFRTGFSREETNALYIRSNSTDYYGIDELIVYNEEQHTEDYTIETTALSPYTTTDPYIDIYFGDGFKENEITGINITASSNTSYVVSINGSWYYNIGGSWSASDASYAQSSDPSTLETKFASLYFNENFELIIRAYFHSDGYSSSWIDEITIQKNITEAQPAIIVGTISIDTVDLSEDYNITITTSFESKEVDLSSEASNAATVTLDEIKAAIDAAEIEGLAPVNDDGNGHLVLISSNTGSDSFVSVSDGSIDSALEIVWGYEANDSGEEVTGPHFDYSEIFRWIKAQLGAPIVPVELTDEQLKDCVSSSVYWYNYYRNAKESFIYVMLEGNPHDGWEIPEEVAGEDNIIDIVMKPRFPFTYFTGRDDFIGQAYMQWFFQQYQSGYKHWLGDYFITVSVKQDLNNIMGTNVQWHFYNGKIFLHPKPPENMMIGIRFRSAVTMNEINTNKFIKGYALGKAKTILGNIRATFGGSIPGGSEMIQLRGEALITEGKEEMGSTLDTLRSLSEPLGFDWG
jgi:hypothetical protein